MKNLMKALSSGQILMYGYKDDSVPVELTSNNNERVSVYVKSPRKFQDKEYSSILKKYHNTQDIGWDIGDVVFMDNEAIKGVVVGFPSASTYVLLSLDVPRYWLWLLVGVTRRICIRQIKIKGVVWLGSKKRKRPWLVLERLQQWNGNTFYFSNKIGIQGMLDHLREKKLNYVVIRFYQKLPHLYREGGDLDMLVSDADTEYLKNYLASNPGNIRVDVWNVSAPVYNGVSYYIPRLATQILNNSVTGPAGSFVPNKKESLLSLIYHALYHKGINSGITSTTKGIESLNNPNNPYITEINNMSKQLNLNVGSTMEELDDFMHLEGWQPKIDTLAKIAQWNEWAKVRFFNNSSFAGEPISVFILREVAVINTMVDEIKNLIRKQGFKIIESAHLEGESRVNASKYLRGGTWKDAMFSESTTIFEPAYAMVIMDLHMDTYDRFQTLKEKIRQKFDTEGPSIVHSTDNEIEAWDYVFYCFPDMKNNIEEDIKDTSRSKKRKPLYLRFMHYIRFLPYYKTVITSKIRRLIIKLVTE